MSISVVFFQTRNAWAV